jgi:hypothetical protein
VTTWAAPNRIVPKHGCYSQNAFGFDDKDTVSAPLGKFESRSQKAMNFDGLAMAGE